MKKIICFHLLNDYSGSPKVLEMVIRGLASKGFNFNLHTSKNGVLNQLYKNKNVNIFYNNYTFVEGSNIQFLKLEDGAKRAKEIAGPKMEEVKEKVGLILSR